LIRCIIFKFRKWHTCNYEWYRLYRSYENCRRPGVAILDMQMSKVPIISGYVLLTDLLWRCCDCGVVYIAVYWFIVTLLWLWRCLFRCLLVYCDVAVSVALFLSLLTDLLWPVVVTVALFISLFTGLLWRCCDCGVVYIAAYWSIVTGCCDCGVVYIAVYWFIVTLLWLWRCLYRCLLVYYDVVVTVALFIFISRNWGYFPHKYSSYLN
jgi:hypothetical protein